MPHKHNAPDARKALLAYESVTKHLEAHAQHSHGAKKALRSLQQSGVEDYLLLSLLLESSIEEAKQDLVLGV